MRQFIIEETYRYKGIKCTDLTINQRMENLILSLAITENEYRTQHPKSSIPFQRWLSGDLTGLRDNDYRRRYINALLRPINGYKGVHSFNQCKDSYYAAKLEAGLIVPFTEKELRKRSYSPKQSTSEEGDKKPHFILQGREPVGFDGWIYRLMTTIQYDRGGQSAITAVNFEGTPEAVFLAKESEQEVRDRMRKAGFSPADTEAALGYLQATGDLQGKRGAKKAICEHLNITRDKLNWLIRRLDKFVAETRAA